MGPPQWMRLGSPCLLTVLLKLVKALSWHGSQRFLANVLAPGP